MSTTGKFHTLDPQHPQFCQAVLIDHVHFERPWKPDEWLGLDWAHHLFFGIEIELKISGIVLFHRVAADETAHLLKICLLPEWRGTGLAVEFWDQTTQALKTLGVQRVFLEVETENKRAIGFYKKLGFEDLRVIKGFYSDGAHALTMQLGL